MNQVAETAGLAVPGLPFPAAGLLGGGLSGPDSRIEVPLDQVSFTHAQTTGQLRSIAHLREAIALPAAVREAPAFARLEKKETKRAS
jgi:hypothetical protein